MVEEEEQEGCGGRAMGSGLGWLTWRMQAGRPAVHCTGWRGRHGNSDDAVGGADRGAGIQGRHPRRSTQRMHRCALLTPHCYVAVPPSGPEQLMANVCTAAVTNQAIALPSTTTISPARKPSAAPHQLSPLSNRPIRRSPPQFNCRHDGACPTSSQEEPRQLHRRHAGAHHHRRH